MEDIWNMCPIMLTDAPPDSKTKRDDMEEIWNMCLSMLTDAPLNPQYQPG